MTSVLQLHDVVIVVIVMKQEECSVHLTSVRIGQVLEESLVIGKVVLIDRSI